MGLLNGIAKLAGESVRRRRTANQEAKLDQQTKEWLDRLRQKAQNGDVNAMFELGGCYYHGKYVAYDPDQACQWWTKAANSGHINSQYNLGLLYHGDVSSYYYDENLAGHWFNMAASNGDQEAYKMLQNYKYSEFRKKWVRR